MVMRTEWRSYASFEYDERHLVRIETDLRIYCEFHGLLSEFVGASELAGVPIEVMCGYVYAFR